MNRMGNRKFLKRIFSIACMLFLIGCLSQCSKNPSYTLITLDSQAGYTFKITRPVFYEVTIPILCEGTKAGTVIFPDSDIGYISSGVSVQFQLRENQMGDLVIIVDHQHPTLAWAIYDLQNIRNSWPSPDASMSWEEQYRILDELLERLRQNFGTSFEAKES